MALTSDTFFLNYQQSIVSFPTVFDFELVVILHKKNSASNQSHKVDNPIIFAVR